MKIFSVFISLLFSLVFCAIPDNNKVIFEKNELSELIRFRDNFLKSKNFPYGLFRDHNVKTLKDMKKSLDFLLESPDEGSNYMSRSPIIFELKNIIDDLVSKEHDSDQEFLLVENLKKLKPENLAVLHAMVQGPFISSLSSKLQKYLTNCRDELFEAQYGNDLVSRMRSMQMNGLKEEESDDFRDFRVPSYSQQAKKNYGRNGSRNTWESQFMFPTMSGYGGYDDTYYQTRERSIYDSPAIGNKYKDWDRNDGALHLNPSWEGRRDYYTSKLNLRRDKDPFEDGFNFRSDGLRFSMEENGCFGRLAPSTAPKIEKVPENRDLFSQYFGLDTFPFDLKNSNFKTLKDLADHLDALKIQGSDDDKTTPLKLKIRSNIKIVITSLTGFNEELVVKELVKLEYKPLRELLGLPKELKTPCEQNEDENLIQLLFSLKNLYESVYSLILNKFCQFGTNLKKLVERSTLDQSNLQSKYKIFMNLFLTENVIVFDTLLAGRKEVQVNNSVIHDELLGEDEDASEDYLNEIDFDYYDGNDETTEDNHELGEKDNQEITEPTQYCDTQDFSEENYEEFNEDAVSQEVKEE